MPDLAIPPLRLVADCQNMRLVFEVTLLCPEATMSTVLPGLELVAGGSQKGATSRED